MNLYQLTDAYKLVQAAAEEDDDGAFETALADLQGAIGDKAENIARLVVALEAEAGAYDAEAKRLTARRDARRNRVEGLKTYLKSNLLAAGIDRVKGALFTVAIQASPPSLKILDREAIPDTFRVYPPLKWQPDTRAILQVARDGQTVPGTEVVRGTHLVIR